MNRFYQQGGAHMFHSIRTRLIFTFLFFLALIECAQLLIIYFFTNDAYFQQKKELLAQAYNEINDDEFDDAAIFEDIKAVLQDYEQTSNLYFSISNEQTKELLYATNNNDLARKNEKRFSKFIAHDHQDPCVHVITGNNSSKWLVLSGSILTDNNSYQILIWTCYEAEFQNAIQSLTPVVIIMLLVSCLIGILLSINISGRIVKPIKQIDLAAQNIADLHFDNKIILPKHKDEIYRLAQNIDKMSDKLERDMNTLKEVNEQLALDIEEKSRIDQMRRQFLSNISHDLKTPRAIISSYAEMIKYEGEHINTEEYLDVIMEESSHMTKMVASLLELSRLEYAADHFILSPCNISETVQSLLENRLILFTQNDLQVTSDITPDLIVNADECYLAQAFDNYFSNAMKYSIKPGTVTVSLKQENNEAVFSVSNPCQALSEEEQQSIWESFYKVDKSRTTSEHMSVGLGLYIVKTIVTAHKGSYHVENTDSGITFSIRLKINDANFALEA